MIKVAIIYFLNVAVIMAVVTTLRETPETYIEWKIEKFLDLRKDLGYIIRSPKFPFANSEWSIHIYPNGPVNRDSDGYISLYLKKSEFDGEYHVEYIFGYITSNGSEFMPFKIDHTFNKSQNSWGTLKHIKISELLKLKDTVVPENTLTVFCKLRMMNSMEVIPKIISSTGIGTLPEDLKNLYAGGRFTDVTIKVKNREFSAHKNILSSRLTAFGSLRENIPNKIEITDCDPDSFEEFLLFVYTGKLVKVSSKKAMSLYLTANKYHLPELKEECARSIAENDLHLHSFFNILRFAKLHSDTVLLTAISDFFITHAKFILLTEDWEKYLKQDSLQANELFLRYVEKKY